MEVTEYLLNEGGVDVNNEDLKGVTPLIMAKRSGKKQIINLLVQYGAK
jgi:ankyrin repeat protein